MNIYIPIFFSLFVILMLYYCAYKASNFMTFKPHKVTMNTIKNLEKVHGKNIIVGNFIGPDGNTIWYKLYNKYKEPSWSDPITMYVHGNSGWFGANIEFEYLQEMNKYSSIFTFDYRGYGLNDGSPSESGVYRDTVAAWKFLTKKHKDIKTILPFGHSLGAATLAHLMSHIVRDEGTCPPRIILSSPFYSMREISTEVMPCFGNFNLNRFPTHSFVSDIKGSTDIIYIHSDDDELIGTHHTYKLNRISGGDVYIVSGMHNDPSLTKNTVNMIEDVFARMR